jgi:ornithine cyclodeaminase/alanine dehydrogenase-like protein (mu-crystallin family)
MADSRVTESLLFLDRAGARRCGALLDPVDVIESVLVRHAEGRTVLPAEGYLAWENSEGAYTRSIAMLGAVTADRPVYGLKVINASVSNPARGMERAGGVSMLFDPETARPVLLVEAAYLSALRTAAYTVATMRRLAPAGAGSVSVLGCGALARAHLELVVRYLPSVTTAYVFDLVPERAKALVAWAAEALPGLDVRITGSARECAGAGTQVITLTVSDTPYATIDWFRPGTFVAHVSLDDLRADVFGGAEAVYVDDVELVRENPRRILGRLMREGLIAERGTVPGPGGRALAGTLGEILLGRVEPRRPTDGVVVSNPFGMSVLDVGLVSAVHAVAVAEGLGTRLDLMGDR